jgi:hypothetical protein
VSIWYIFSGFGIMYKEKSGNPATQARLRYGMRNDMTGIEKGTLGKLSIRVTTLYIPTVARRSHTSQGTAFQASRPPSAKSVS